MPFRGDPALRKLSDALPQLRSRLPRRVILRGLPEQDVAIPAAHRGIEDRGIIATLHRAGRRGAGLRDVDTAISHAWLMAGRQMPGRAHLVAALQDLNLRLGERE